MFLLLSLALGGEPPHALRISTAEKGYTTAVQMQAVGTGRVDDVCTWSARWMRAVRESGAPGAESAHLERMRALDVQTQKAFSTGTVGTIDVLSATYCLAEAEVWDAEAKNR